MNAPPLQTHDLAVGYRRGRRETRLASGLHLRLEAGSLVALLGRNGIGKSTLLRTLARLHPPLAGRVLLDGADVHKLLPMQLAKRLSLMLTEAPAPSMMTAYELVALGRTPHSDWLGRLSRRDRQAIDWALSALDASHLARHQLRELSDGQRQKLMIARALAQETPLILLDEPTAFLDLPHRIETMTLLRRLARQTGLTILISTHELHLALRHCDALWLMSKQRIQVGAPADLTRDGSISAAYGLKLDDIAPQASL